MCRLVPCISSTVILFCSSVDIFFFPWLTVFVIQDEIRDFCPSSNNAGRPDDYYLEIAKIFNQILDFRTKLLQFLLVINSINIFFSFYEVLNVIYLCTQILKCFPGHFCLVLIKDRFDYIRLIWSHNSFKFRQSAPHQISLATQYFYTIQYLIIN